MANDNLDFTGQDIGAKGCEVPFTGKKFEGLTEIPNHEDEKQIIKVKWFTDFSFEPPRICFFHLNDHDLINPINIDNMDFTKIGQLVADSPITITEIPYKNGLVICADAADQDVVALIQPFVDAFIAELLADGYTVPAGSALGLSKIGLQQFTDKQPVQCHAGLSAGTEVVVAAESPIVATGLIGEPSEKPDNLVVNGGHLTYCRHLIDDGKCQNCALASGMLLAGEVTANGAVGTAYRVDFCVACFTTPAP